MTLTRAETPDPLAVGRVVLRLACGQGRGLDRAKQILGSQDTARGGEFSVKNTSAGECDPSATIWCGQDVLVVGADVDRDARLLLEGRHQCLGGLHVLPAVERDGVGARAGTGAATGGQARRHPGRGLQRRSGREGISGLLTRRPAPAPHQGVPVPMAQVRRRPSPWTPPATGRQRMVQFSSVADLRAANLGAGEF